MKVKILKCSDYNPHFGYYTYTVRVYDGVAQGTYKVEVSKQAVMDGTAEELIREELEKMAASKLRKQIDENKAQSIVGKIFHW